MALHTVPYHTTPHYRIETARITALLCSVTEPSDLRVRRPENNLARDELGALQLDVHLLGHIGDRHHDCRLPVC
jgi:hypothetical protein